MAIYASAEEMVRPPPGRTSRWTVTILLTAFLALIYFLQSEEAAESLVALQDTVIKKTAIRGIANRTGFSFQDKDIDEEFAWEDDELEDVTADVEPEENNNDPVENKIPSETDNNEADEPNEGPVEEQADSEKGEEGTRETDDKKEPTTENKQAEGTDSMKDQNEEIKAINDAVQNEETEDAKHEGDTETVADGGVSTSGVDITTADSEKQDSNECSSVCSLRVQQHKERWGGNLLNMNEVGRLAREAYDKFIAQLKVDYGEDNFANIFEVDGKSRGRTAFLPANTTEGVSLKRFKRKLKMKILVAQISIEEELNSFGDCNCKTGKRLNNRRFLETDRTLPPLADHHERFVWATGGHSSAAAHGNLFNESYTAVMEHALSGIFGAVGIDFEGRSYAMGGTDSAPEIALCNEAIFGTDVDVLSWDFAMTDGRLWDRKGMYANRGAGLNPNRPAVIDMFIDKFVERRTEELRKVEERGLTGLYMNPDAFKEMKDGIPDTFGLTSEQIDAMPRMVRHFKCQDMLEKGDPTCSQMKFDDKEICPDRNFMASWHPGWKMMALSGNTIALFMSEMLLDAIEEIGDVSDRIALLRHLQTEENIEYQKFSNSDVPAPEDGFLKEVGDELLNETDLTPFFRSPSICHTARLPAQSRYLGILTESDQTGVHDYFKGIPKEEADKMETADDSETPMPLVYDPRDRQTCEVELNRDYKDYFFSSDKMGWTTLTFPNKVELEAYGRTSWEYKGILVMCLKHCDWGKCPAGNMQLEAIQKGQVKLEINGLPVATVTKFNDCTVLRGEHGHYWKANEDGQYTLRAKVLGDGSDFSFLRISSLILL